MTAIEHVTRPDRITPDWLTAALRRSGAAQGSVRDFTVEPLGEGNVADCVRITLDWAGSGPASVVAKFPAADERSRATGQASGSYEREVSFYRTLAPLTPLPVPACHLAEHDPGTGEFALLLADLAPARPGDQLAGCAAGEVADLLPRLAAHQVRLRDEIEGQPWLPVRSADGGRNRAAIYRLVGDRFLERFGDRLSAGAVAVLERCRAAMRAWGRADRGPFTVLHGDLRADNLLFGADSVTVVDWQTVTVGPGASDAAYLVGGSLPTEVRRGCEGELFNCYLAGLLAGGVEADRDRVWADYRVNTLAGLHMTVVGAMLVGPGERSDEMFVTMTERHAAHIADLDPFSALEAV
ncbi:phosphotransferase family protein [Actinokineospora enzanensis]|uniref:phosphotransferase family protein n=1 Tax=Actinokineospora enzanensis TaxID=155975 RepID=UPI00036F3287|nr:aminoglycoside phosphotransferase family protein [Actinokineospora enzanensis]